MNVTTLSGSRQRKTQQHAPWSGGRTAAREDYATEGTAALQPEVRPKESRPARLTVAPPAPVTAPRAPFVALVLVLVITGVVGILVLNTKIAENAFTLDTLHNQQIKLDRDEERLKSDIANQESPVTLAARATQLGLGKSTTSTFLLLPDGTKLEMPGPSGQK
jgi:hypothetical protein